MRPCIIRHDAKNNVDLDKPAKIIYLRIRHRRVRASRATRIGAEVLKVIHNDFCRPIRKDPRVGYFEASDDQRVTHPALS